MRPEHLVAIHTTPWYEIKRGQAAPILNVHAEIGARAELHDEVDVCVVFLAVSGVLVLFELFEYRIRARSEPKLDVGDVGRFRLGFETDRDGDDSRGSRIAVKKS